MLKVVVFDSGWGGEIVADFLESELKTVEIIRLIDWANSPYEKLPKSEIIKLTENNLQDYIGNVDLIILGNYDTALALPKLRRKYPKQKFIGLRIDFGKIKKLNHQSIAILTNQIVRKTPLLSQIKSSLPKANIILPNCTGWEGLINLDLLSVDVINAHFSHYFSSKNALPNSKLIELHSKTKHLSSRSLGDVIRQEKFQRCLIPLFNDLEKLSLAIRRERMQNLIDQGPSLELNALQKTSAKQSLNFHPDTLVLLSTSLWDYRKQLENWFSWPINILDFRQELLYDTCKALNLLGVDGKRH